MKKISAYDFLEMIKDKNHKCQIIDVRTPAEWKEAKLDDNRVYYWEMNTVPNHLSELQKQLPVYVLCRSGNRSGMVTNFLQSHGYDASNIEGGIMQIRFLQQIKK